MEFSFECTIFLISRPHYRTLLVSRDADESTSGRNLVSPILESLTKLGFGISFDFDSKPGWFLFWMGKRLKVSASISKSISISVMMIVSEPIRSTRQNRQLRSLMHWLRRTISSTNEEREGLRRERTCRKAEAVSFVAERQGLGRQLWRRKLSEKEIKKEKGRGRMPSPRLL